MTEQCSNCGSEVDEVFTCWGCGQDICEDCMRQPVNSSGDYCEGCAESGEYDE